MYISTNPDDLLGRALDRTGKKPDIQVCNWLDRDKPLGSPPDGEKEPDPDNPLVYHLFGHLSAPASLVLSEDDYFKFLVGISNENANRAASVTDPPRAAHLNALLRKSGLMFLGFRLDDWDFRAFLHFFLNREAARNRSKDVLDVAVQLDPADGRYSDPELVRRYLEGLFNRSNVNIYWGSTEEFLQELDAECRR